MPETLTLIEKTIFLKSIEIFAAVPTEALAQLATRAAEVHVDRQDTVFREGDADDGLLIVIDGQIELRKGDAVVRLLQRGTVQGELFQKASGTHEYTAVALEDTTVVTLGHGEVFEALMDYPEFAVAMIQDLASRHRHVVARVIELEAQLAAVAPGGPLSGSDGEAVEPPAPAPALPKRRGWWRLASRPIPK